MKEQPKRHHALPNDLSMLNKHTKNAETAASGRNNFDNSEIANWCTGRSPVIYTRHNGLRPVPWPWGTDQTWPVTPVQAPFVRGRSEVF